MTAEKTAVKGSDWFIFQGKGDGMNSKLRGTRGRAVYRLGKAATAQASLTALTGVLLMLRPGQSGQLRLRKGVRVSCRSRVFKGLGACAMGGLTLPA